MRKCLALCQSVRQSQTGNREHLAAQEQDAPSVGSGPGRDSAGTSLYQLSQLGVGRPTKH